MEQAITIKIEKIENAVSEARRFVASANRWKCRLKKDKWSVFCSKEAAAAKRASLDLTRALAEFRK